jgi:2-oxoglutarate ferredoxin oxidoreductase subunit beta
MRSRRCCDERAETAVRDNPVNAFLRKESMPASVPGCGIGTTVYCFARAITECGTDLDKIAIVSGIGCTAASPDT